MSFALQLLGAMAVLSGVLVWLDRGVSEVAQVASKHDSARRDA